MIDSAKKTLLLFTFLFTFSFSSFADHIAGGDITVKWISGNNFEIKLQFFRDCNTAVPFDPTIHVGIFDKTTNAMHQDITMVNPVISVVPLGDACYTPTTCIEKGVYTQTVNIPNNPNGYYISFHRCCRNAVITNIITPNAAGFVIYCEIPNPALHNSTPTFNSLPDGFMCRSYTNTDNFTCTDLDGDQLVYSFSTPLDCAPTGICSSNLTIPAGTSGSTLPGAWPKPYGTITWASGYSLANQIGDPAMVVNPTTGIVITTPPNNGTYVFCVKVEEYRAGVKIGEIRRDFQFQMLPCSVLIVNGQGGSTAVCLGESTTLSASNVGAGFTYSWNPGGQTTTSIVVTPTIGGTYNYTVTATNALCVYKATYSVNASSGPHVNITTTNSTCGPTNGTATATASGGTPGAYVYSWVPGGQTTSTITGLAAGTYSVTVSNSGCTNTTTSTASVTTVPLLVTVSVTATGCAVPNGTATANASGGPGTYFYSWMPGGQTTQTATGLAAGNYTVTVSNSACANTGTNTVTISTAPAPSVAVSSTASGCAGANGTATAAASGGTSPYSYSWSNGQTTSVISGLGAGTYTILVTDSKGCTKTTSVIVTYAALSVTVSATTTGCSLANGTATANAPAGSGTYSYSWMPGGQTTQTATGLAAGAYTVTVSNSACANTGKNTVTISTAPAPSVNTSSTASGCTVPDGTATATISGGTSPYTYSWSSGQTTSAISGLNPGTYTIIITDSKSCTKTNTINVAMGIPSVAFTVSGTISCYGGSNGSITANPSGGVLAYTYVWSNGQTTKTATGLAAGSYSITVTDGKACTRTTSVSITQPTALSGSTSVTNPSVCNVNDGSATSTVSGGTPAYAYLWSNGKTTASTTGLGAGVYSILITDARGCTNTNTVAVNAPGGPIATSTVTAHVSCRGGNEGAAIVNSTGGTGAHTYSWSNGQTTNVATGLSAGTHVATVTDATGCVYSAPPVIISQPSFSLTVTPTVKTTISCNGGNDGAVSASPTGGTPAYSYSWNNGQTTQIATGLAAGSYSVNIVDSKGCTTTNSISVTQPTVGLSATIAAQTNVTCYGGTNGSATVTPSCGTNPHTYLWSDGQITATATGLTTGSYSITVTDFNGYTATTTVTITQPADLNNSLCTQKNVSCMGGNNGSATVYPTGGISPYTYSWSNGQITQGITGLVPGPYSITVTDAAGCAATKSVTITQPSALSSTYLHTNIFCAGVNNGRVTLYSAGGTSPYTYAWSNGQTNVVATGLAAGPYTVNITDSKGCTTTNSVTITQPTVLSSSISVTNSSSCSVGNGSAAVTASGGIPAYTYSWSNGQTTPATTGLSAGVYSILITDANGCTNTNTATISSPGSPTVTFSVISLVMCYGGNSGSASPSSTGGAPPYSYSWSTGQTTPTATGLTAGAYTVTVTDKQGCTATATVTITQPTAPLSNTLTVTNASSCDVSDGWILLSPAGGTPPYKYLWSSGHTTGIVTGLVQGTYTVTLTDARNCTHTTTTIVSCPTGAGELSEQSNFVISPNPTNGKFEIRITSYDLRSENTEIIIHNFLGAKVYQSRLVNLLSYIDISSQQSGIYFLQIKTGNVTVVTKKIIKQ